MLSTGIGLLLFCRLCQPAKSGFKDDDVKYIVDVSQFRFNYYFVRSSLCLPKCTECKE